MLHNKTIFITGASSGIGKASAWQFAEKGAHLVLNARSLETLEALKKKIQGEFPDCKIHVSDFDVRHRDAVTEKIAAIPDEFKDIEVLVNSAGLGRGREKFHTCEVNDWEEMIDTNIKGLLYVTHAVTQGMVKRKTGTIINVGSIAGKETYPCGNVYCATKSAVRTLSEGMRIDLVDYGIRVCDIQPGKVETNFSHVRFRGDKSKYEHEYDGYTPLEAEDVARAIVFVADSPQRVQITELAISPTDQASAVIFRKNE